MWRRASEWEAFRYVCVYIECHHDPIFRQLASAIFTGKSFFCVLRRINCVSALS